MGGETPKYSTEKTIYGSSSHASKSFYDYSITFDDLNEVIAISNFVNPYSDAVALYSFTVNGNTVTFRMNNVTSHALSSIYYFNVTAVGY